MLWSIGKDSTVPLWLARKAFFGHVPMPLVHIDTSYKIPEMIQYRDRLAAEWRLTVIYGQNEEALAAKQTFPDGNVDRLTCCGNLKTGAAAHTVRRGQALSLRPQARQGAVDTNTEPYTGVIVGARADEEGSRSKERYFSPRSGENNWNIADQPPEFWNQYATEFAPGRTCASIRCSIGRSSTSGSTSSASAFPPSASTTTRARRALSLARLLAVHEVGHVGRQERAGDHRRAEERPLREHRGALGPRAGQGRRRGLESLRREGYMIATHSSFGAPCRTPHTTRR